MPIFRICTSLFAASLCLCAFTTPLRAESSIPGCMQGAPNVFHSIPESDGETIPANTPALQVLYLGPAWKLETAQILDPNNQPVPITISGSYLVRPVQPLTEGNGYSLIWTSSCSDYTGPSSQTTTRLFNAGPAVSLPTTIGTVTMVQPYPYGVSDAKFNLHLSPEAQAFSSFAMIRTRKPGQEIVQTFNYGKKDADLSLSFPAPCPTLGHREDSFQVSYTILGIESEWLALDVPFSYECEKTTSPIPDAGTDVPADPDSGQTGLPDVVVDTSTNDTGSSDALPDGPDNIGEHTDGTGCSLAHKPGFARLPLLMLAGAIALGRCRRRSELVSIE